MSPAKSDLPQGTLDLLILTIVASGPQHGYAIAQRLQRISNDVIHVRQGSLYPALHRLDNRGLLATAWRQSETGRDARYYSLTKKGRAALERERASWRKFTRAINVVLRTAGLEA
jgi:PadR family transcriptional regulator, regulatory protein PadR